jgi:hypothetical protein
LFFFETGSLYVAQVGLELTIFLPYLLSHQHVLSISTLPSLAPSLMQSLTANVCGINEASVNESQIRKSEGEKEGISGDFQ